jgi:hypothetical protein
MTDCERQEAIAILEEEVRHKLATVQAMRGRDDGLVKALRIDLAETLQVLEHLRKIHET